MIENVVFSSLDPEAIKGENMRVIVPSNINGMMTGVMHYTVTKRKFVTITYRDGVVEGATLPKYDEKNESVSGVFYIVQEIQELRKTK